MNNFNGVRYIHDLKSCYICGCDTLEIEQGDLCPCCSIEWGVDEHQHDNLNSTLTNFKEFKTSIKLIREKWLIGFDFYDEFKKPKGWNKEMALQQIKDNVPEELQ